FVLDLLGDEMEFLDPVVHAVGQGPAVERAHRPVALGAAALAARQYGAAGLGVQRPRGGGDQAGAAGAHQLQQFASGGHGWAPWGGWTAWWSPWLCCWRWASVSCG